MKIIRWIYYKIKLFFSWADKRNGIIGVAVAATALFYAIWSSNKQSEVYSNQLGKLDTIALYTDKLIETQIELSKPKIITAGMNLIMDNNAKIDSFFVFVYENSIKNKGIRSARMIKQSAEFMGLNTNVIYRRINNFEFDFEGNNADKFHYYVYLHSSDLPLIYAKIGYWWEDTVTNKTDSLIGNFTFSIQDDNYTVYSMDKSSLEYFERESKLRTPIEISQDDFNSIAGRYYPNHRSLHKKR